jgi:hypothetical protein
MGDVSSPASWPWPHFSFDEMKCHGERCCGGCYSMRPEMMDALEELRARLGGKPLVITSGYRCPAHNVMVSATGPGGPHTTGMAADIRVHSIEDREQLIEAARKLGFQRFGRARTFVHIDLLRPPWPCPAEWTYP